MIKLNYKLFFFIIILLLFSFRSFSDDIKIENSFVTIGSNKSEVEIKVYSSLTCPHCANFHINSFGNKKKLR